jgi:monoamine oxidase
LVNALARGVDVRTGTVVSRIEYSEKGVTVETSNGVVRGSHVVVTVPLGVLKAGSIEFSPALPAEKSQAIDRLAMAQLEKVVLRYDDAFWQSPGSGNLLYLAAQAGEFPLFVDYTPYAEEKPTLVAFYCGDYGRAMASMSDDAIAGRAAAIVNEMTRTTAPSPHTAHVTRWKSDPYALGSYVYLPVGATVDDIEALAAPVGERLLFSGEATSTQYSGYVHGAILSGIREAERLLDRRGQGVELESGLVVEKGCDETA